MRLLLTASLVIVLSGSSPSFGQVVNGDFSQGATGWKTSGDPAAFRFVFPTTGIDGFASIQHILPSEKAEACIEQTVECAPGDGSSTCRIAVDYKIASETVESSTPILVGIRVDGQELATATHAFITPWKTLTGSISKGSHLIQLCFQSESHGATVDFDSVVLGEGLVPTVPTAWGAIKARY